MNLALSAIFILFLISPGFVVRYAFLKGPYSRHNFKPSFSDELFWSIIPAFVFHLCGFVIVEKWLDYEVSLSTFYYLLTSPISDQSLDFATISAGIPAFLNYSLAVFFFSALLGFAGRHTVIRFKLDQKFSIFRIKNEWYYLLSGKILEEGADEVDFVQIDALVDTSEGAFIYSGILADYVLTNDGGLDRMYLINVYRRRLQDDIKFSPSEQSFDSKRFDKRYYNMPGKYLALPYKEVSNMNISYYQVEY